MNPDIDRVVYSVTAFIFDPFITRFAANVKKYRPRSSMRRSYFYISAYSSIRQADTNLSCTPVFITHSVSDTSINSGSLTIKGLKDEDSKSQEKKTPDVVFSKFSRDTPKLVPVMVIRVPGAPIWGVTEVILGSSPSSSPSTGLGTEAELENNTPLLRLPLTCT
jgi:hypothetical protein